MIHSKQIKILIADENASVRNTLTLTLAQHVGDIFEAQQALDTLDLFNDKLPNIVFLDSMIGGELDGVTLCQLIKSMRLPHYCFVVLLLPKASQSLIDECEAAGADNYLIKPFTPSQVLDALATFDIGLIPFKINELTASVDPVKYYEYRAAALPILSSRFGDMALRNSDDGVYFFESMQAGQLMVETMLKQALIPDPSFIRINQIGRAHV